MDPNRPIYTPLETIGRDLRSGVDEDELIKRKERMSPLVIIIRAILIY